MTYFVVWFKKCGVYIRQKYISYLNPQPTNPILNMSLRKYVFMSFCLQLKYVIEGICLYVILSKLSSFCLAL